MVRGAIQQELPANKRSLSEAILEGLSTFEEAGGPEGYFGDPARATPEEGSQTIQVLGRILAEAALAELGMPIPEGELEPA